MALIEGFRVRNYRALRDVTLGKLSTGQQQTEPLTPFTVVIGKNGAGKSTLFDAFGFVADCLSTDVETACDAKQRGGFEREARRFADAQGYSVDWGSVERLDDRSLINGVSQIAPFDPASKQALLEAETLTDRCELLVQLMQFYGRTDGGEEITTLQ